MTGYYQEDLIDNRELSYKELILSEDRKNLRDKIQRSVEEGECYKHTYRIRTADGEVKWVWEQGKAVESENDHTYFEGIIIDITDMKEMERELEKSEERYRTIFQSANDAIMIMDRNEFVDCNEKTEEMFKCDRKEMIGRAPWEFSPKKQPDGRPSKEKTREKIYQAFEGEATFFEWVHKKKWMVLISIPK